YCASNYESHTQTLTVEDTTPQVFSGTLPADITLNSTNITYTVILRATDNCDNNVDVDFNETVSGNETCGGEYTITRTWTAQDCAGNSASHTQTITVEDTTAPVFSGTLPADITRNCANITAPVTLT